MKALNPSTGQFEEVYVKALDSMPVGTEVDFDGQASDIPIGWEVAETSKNITTASIVNGTLTSANLDIKAIKENKVLKLYGTIVYSASYTITQVDIATGLNIVSADTTLRNIAILEDATDHNVRMVLNGTLNSSGKLSILVNPSTNGHSYKVCFLNNEIEI